MTKEEAIDIVRNIYQTDKEKEALSVLIPELRESEDERIRKNIVKIIRDFDGLYLQENYQLSKADCLAYLEKQKEQKPKMILWTGKNLKEVIDFTGKYPRLDEWFKSWEEYENYVHSHNNIFKLFCEDGSYYEVPVGSWIVKTPDGFNIPSLFKFVQKPVKLNDNTKVGLDRALQIVKAAKGNLYGYQSDDGIYECDHAIQTLEYILMNGIEQKPTERIEDSVKFEEGFKTGRESGLRDGQKYVLDNAKSYGLCKPAEWSDTDDIGWDEAFACVTRAEKFAKNEEELQNAVTAEKWLKEIKFKYCVHPFKQEWSEEDKKMLDDIIYCLPKMAMGNVELLPSVAEEYANRLESLRFRFHWKPSEEQMGALKECGECKRCIKELYEQLKKRYEIH